MTSETLQTISQYGQIASVVLAVAAALAGGLGGWAGQELSKETDTKVALSNERAAEANQKAAEAGRNAEEIRQENLRLAESLLKLEKGLAPRTFTEQQSRIFNARLSGVGKVYVVADGDVESGHYADLISIALQAGGRLAGGLRRIGDGIGVRVYVRTSTANYDPGNDPLKLALEAAGVLVTGWGAGPTSIALPLEVELQPGERVIIIGTKPLPPDHDVPVLGPPKPGQAEFYVQAPPRAEPSSP